MVNDDDARRTTPWGEWIRQDLEANRTTSARSRLVVTAFRAAQAAERLPGPVAALVARLYQVVVEWLMGIELPPETSVGPGLAIQHGVGLVVNADTIIGANCTLRHGVTIGNKAGPGRSDDCPVLGDGVDVGAHAVILGPVTVEDGATIGAASVVIRDVAASTVVVGNPARVVDPADSGRS